MQPLKSVRYQPIELPVRIPCEFPTRFGLSWLSQLGQEEVPSFEMVWGPCRQIEAESAGDDAFNADLLAGVYSSRMTMATSAQTWRGMTIIKIRFSLSANKGFM